MSEKIFIYGRGLSAATIAQKAQELGYKVYCYGGELGGLCKDHECMGTYISEYGPHIFHTDKKEVWDFVNKFSDWVPYMNAPVAQYGDKFYSMPISLYTLQQIFGTGDAKKLAELLACEVDVSCANPKNAKEMALSKVGKKIYEILFEQYTKKQWKKDPSELDKSIFERIPIRMYWNNNYFNDTYQGLPLNGYTTLIKNLFGEAVMLDYDDVDLSSFHKVFICDALDLVGGMAFGKIPYLKTGFKRVNVDQRSAVVNHCDDTTPFTRTTNYSLLWPKRRSRLDFCMSEEPLGEGLPSQTDVHYSVDCYPARDTETYEKYKKYFEGQGFVLCGRLAENLYLNMDAAIENAWEKCKLYL